MALGSFGKFISYTSYDVGNSNGMIFAAAKILDLA